MTMNICKTFFFFSEVTTAHPKSSEEEKICTIINISFYSKYIYIYIVVCITVVVFSILRIVSPLHVFASTVVVFGRVIWRGGFLRGAPRLAAVFVAAASEQRNRTRTIAQKDF